VRPRGSNFAIVAAIIASTSIWWASTAPSGGAKGAPSSSVPPGLTVTVGIPGRFSGCGYYGASTSESLRALLDLVRPSAFTEKPSGTMIGAPGPISEAELVSLNPQTVVYTLDRRYQWSNGAEFNAQDLKGWYERSRNVPSTLADGYRAIGSAVPSATLDQLTVTFAHPYSAWPALFRDIDERGFAPASCTLASLASQPSLGPYKISSITPTRAVLVADPLWRGAAAGYQRVVIETDLSPLSFQSRTEVDYRYAMTDPELRKITNDGTLNGKVGMSNGIVTVAFSPRSSLTSQLAVRQFLAFGINRQVVDDQVVGPITYISGIADSALLAQDVQGYRGDQGVTPINQSSGAMLSQVPSAVNLDCTPCAKHIIEAAGFTRPGSAWVSPAGQSVSVRLVVGPTPYDHAAGSLIAAEWRGRGAEVVVHDAASDLEAAKELQQGAADAAIMTVWTDPLLGLTSRSFTGLDYGDAYDAGWRSPLVDQWYATAIDTFNPVDAQPSYDSIDLYATTQAWVRPLFTQPALATWSNDVYGVVAADFLPGFIDQIPNWGYTTPKLR
jgi:ABC-type transport system substrate-binding protein